MYGANWRGREGDDRWMACHGTLSILIVKKLKQVSAICVPPGSHIINTCFSPFYHMFAICPTCVRQVDDYITYLKSTCHPCVTQVEHLSMQQNFFFKKSERVRIVLPYDC